MKNILVFTSLLLILLISINTQAQRTLETSDVAKPQWLRGDFPKKTNDTYSHKVVVGEGSTLDDARSSTVGNLILELASERGVNISTSAAYKVSSETKNEILTESTKFSSTTLVDVDGFKASFARNDEYWELLRDKQGKTFYRCWSLFSVAKNINSYKFDEVKFTTSYGATPILKSLVAPGWGQLHKGQNRKGLRVLTSELLMLSGFAASYGFHLSYTDKANNTRDITLRREYLDKADNAYMTSNVFAILAGVIYIYNIVDVSTSRGAKHYLISENVRLYPDIDQNKLALQVSIKF